MAAFLVRLFPSTSIVPIGSANPSRANPRALGRAAYIWPLRIAASRELLTVWLASQSSKACLL